MGGSIEKGLIVRVAVTGEFVVAVHHAALNMYFHVGPLVEGFRHGAGVGGVEDVIECILLAFDDVQTLREFRSRRGTVDKRIAGAAGDIERGVLGYVGVDEDIERALVGRIDAGGVAHVAAAGAHQFGTPIAGIGVGLITVYAEVLLVGGPRVVLYLQCHGYHRCRHTD